VDGSVSTTVPGGSGISRHQGSVERLRRLGEILAGYPTRPDEDWADIADLARHQGVSPLLYWWLAESAIDGERGPDVPQEVLDGLRADLYAATAQGLLAERQLATVLAALSQAEVPAMVIKGAALGSFYPDAALRLYGDIDIMVPQAQLDAAERALTELGYQCFASRGWWLDHFHHLPPMVREGDRVPVELHWRLDYQEAKGRLPVDDLWARAVPWAIHGQPALRLDGVDMVLYLCRHAVVQHRVHGAFRALCDLVQTTEGWGAREWKVLGRRAIDYDLARPVYLVLVLAEQMFHRAVPAPVLETLRPSGWVPEPDELMQHLMGYDGDTAARISVGAVQATADGPVAVRVQHLVRSLFLPRKGMAMVYDIPVDSPQVWLAYLWRPIDLLKRYGLSAWRTLRGEREAQAAWRREVWLERWLRGVPDEGEGEAEPPDDG
jgi:hypothetical protein